MPYKDLEKRRAFARAYYPKIRKKMLARVAAWNAFPEAQPCSIDKCVVLGERHHDDYSKPLEIRWLCKFHHEEQHHSEEKTGTPKLKCRICGSKHRARGLCNKHYVQERKNAEPEYRKRRALQSKHKKHGRAD